MLFTDRMWCTAESLSYIDPELSAVAQAENVNIDTTSSSVLWHYTLAAGEKFLSNIQNFSGYLVGVGVNSNHAAAVMNILSTAINRPRAMLPQITVEEPDPTRRAFARWVRYAVLHDFYRALTRRRLKQNDRYENKMIMFGEERDEHWLTLQGRGFPVILNPLSAPGAIWMYGSGAWGASNVTAASGGSLSAATPYLVSITWCSLPAYQSYANQAGAESAGSVPQSITCQPAQVIAVNLANLNPPTAQMPVAIGTAEGVFPPMSATHWNIYAGPAAGPLCLQNSSPIPIGTTSYQLPDVPAVNGSILNEGQPAMYDFSMPDGMCWRA